MSTCKIYKWVKYFEVIQSVLVGCMYLFGKYRHNQLPWVETIKAKYLFYLMVIVLFDLVQYKPLMANQIIPHMPYMASIENTAICTEMARSQQNLYEKYV